MQASGGRSDTPPPSSRTSKLRFVFSAEPPSRSCSSSSSWCDLALHEASASRRTPRGYARRICTHTLFWRQKLVAVGALLAPNSRDPLRRRRRNPQRCARELCGVRERSYTRCIQRERERRRRRIFIERLREWIVLEANQSSTSRPTAIICDFLITRLESKQISRDGHVRFSTAAACRRGRACGGAHPTPQRRGSRARPFLMPHPLRQLDHHASAHLRSEFR
jgi:hypothetical protein